MKKQYLDLRVGLAEIDRTRLIEIANGKQRTRTEVAREAIRWYLDNYEQLANTGRDSLIEKRLKKLEDRLAKLQIKTAIDAGMIFLLMYRHMDLDERDKAVAWAYSGSIKRLRKKLTEPQTELTDLVKADDQVNSQA